MRYHISKNNCGSCRKISLTDRLVGRPDTTVTYEFPLPVPSSYKIPLHYGFGNPTRSPNFGDPLTPPERVPKQVPKRVLISSRRRVLKLMLPFNHLYQACSGPGLCEFPVGTF